MKSFFAARDLSAPSVASMRRFANRAVYALPVRTYCALLTSERGHHAHMRFQHAAHVKPSPHQLMSEYQQARAC